MFGHNQTLGSTDIGTSFSDIIINNVCSVSDGQVNGFESFLHDPKSLKETVDQIGKMSIPKRFIEAVTARRVATNSINTTWRCPLNLQTPLTCPIPWTIIEASQTSQTADTVEYQIMRMIDFIGRNYIRIELPEVNTAEIATKATKNGPAPEAMTDPEQMYLGAWHRDLVPRIIDKVSFYPRSSQHKLFVYSGYDIAVHNIIFGNANKEMNDLMAGEDKFELAYDPYRVDGSALGIASFKGIDTYKQFEVKTEGAPTVDANRKIATTGLPYQGANAAALAEPLVGVEGEDGFVDAFQLDTTMDDEEFKSFYRRNVWYEAPVAVPYDCRHSIHSRRFFHRKAVIIVPLDVLPFGYSIESSLPTAALAGDCGFISIQRFSDWFDRAFYLTRLSDVPSLHPLVQHRHLAADDIVIEKGLQNGALVDAIGKVVADDAYEGWVDPRSIGRFGDATFVHKEADATADNAAEILDSDDSKIRQEGTVIGRNVAGLEGFVPTVNQPIKSDGSAFSDKYMAKAQAFGGRTIKSGAFSMTSTAASSRAAARLDYNTSGDPVLDNVFLHAASALDKAWYQSHTSAISIKLLQVGYVTLPSIKQLLTKLPNIYITTEWHDVEIDIKSQQFNISNDLYVMALLFWFLPEDSNGIQSIRVYPHHKIDTEYPIIAGIRLQNEQSQGKILYSWDMLNLMTPAHMGLKPLLSNMGIVSFTPLMQPNTLPFGIYDQNLSGYIQGRFEKGDEDNKKYDGYVNMRAGTCKCISIGINGVALVNLSLFRLVF